MIVIKVDTSEWACPKHPYNKTWRSYSTSNFTQYFGDTIFSYYVDTLGMMDAAMRPISRVNSICSCEDEVTVVVRHPEACCSGTLIVQGNKTITLRKYDGNGFVDIGTGSFFSNLCPGIYRVYAGSGMATLPT